MGDIIFNNLPILPIAIPLLAAGLMLLFSGTQRGIKIALGLLSFGSLFWVGLTLMGLTDGSLDSHWINQVGVYLLGNWPSPFSIVVVVDKLTVTMLLLTTLLALFTWIYGTSRWDRKGVHFHPLFQLIVMGLNGSFLTGDLFNLFVFFEVFLAASYGLMLHGSGKERTANGLHYIAVNLLSSFLLLISIAMIYGLTGSLNMADIAQQAAQLRDADRSLFEVAAAILGVAFLIKAAAWPLNFWLIGAYSTASAPVAGLFSIMTKVGIYALLRIGSLLEPAGAPAAFGGAWMFPVGIITLIFGTLGMLAAHQPERLASYCIIISSGTLLAALGMPGVILTAPALYYLLNSVLAVGALFLLLEIVNRFQPFGSELLAVSEDAFDLRDLGDEEGLEETTGIPFPIPVVFLGLSFLACALLIVGLPPLSGFVAKFSLLSAALFSSGATSNGWVLTATVLLSGFAGIMAFSRMGIHLFWTVQSPALPTVRLTEALPVAALIAICAALTIWAGPINAYLEATAHYLGEPNLYIEAVLSQHP